MPVAARGRITLEVGDDDLLDVGPRDDAAVTQDHAILAGVCDRVAKVPGAHCEEVRDRTREWANVGQTDRLPGDGGHRRKGVAEGQVASGHEQRRRLERVDARERIERVPPVVAPSRDDDARRAQRRDRGQCAGNSRRGIPTLEIEVGLGKGDDGDAVPREPFGDRAHCVDIELAEADAMRRGRSPREPVALDSLDEADNRQRVRIEGLVEVEIDRETGVCRSMNEFVDRSWRVVVEGRCAPHAVGAGTERGSEKPAVELAGAAYERTTGHRDHLQIEGVSHVVSERDKRFDRSGPEPLLAAHVRPDRAEAARHGDAQGSPCSARDIGTRHRGVRATDGLDGAEQITRGVPYSVRKQRLVEVGVGFGGGGQQHIAGEVELWRPGLSSKPVGLRPHGLDALARDKDRRESSLGEEGVPQKQSSGVATPRGVATAGMM